MSHKKGKDFIELNPIVSFGTYVYAITSALSWQAQIEITSRDRPKSAPYPRLKKSKKTSKCQVLFYSTRKSKFFENFFFEKIT